MTAQLPLELVEDHLTALRRLAYQLVRDPHDVDDALQETWLIALQAGPGGLHRLRGWLETVLRNVIRRRQRQARRSLAREHAAAVPEAVRPAVDVVMRQQQLRALTAAVVALPRGEQECIFLRYFEGLPPRDIAARIELPVAQVYRTLERAKHRLRRSLTTRDAGRAQGLALLIGLRPAAAGLALGGGLVLTKKMLAGIGLSLVLLLSIGYALRPGTGIDDRIADPPAAPMTVAAPDLKTRSAAAAAGPTPEARNEVEDAVDPLQALAPHVFEMEIHARTEEDLPAAGVSLFVAPELHPLNRARTDDDGVLRLRWRGRVPAMAMVFGSSSQCGGRERLRRVVVHAGHKAQAVVRVTAQEPTVVEGSFVVQIGHALEVTRGTGIVTSGGGMPELRWDITDGICWFRAGQDAEGRPAVRERVRVSYGRLEGGRFRPMVRKLALRTGRGTPRDHAQAPKTRTLTGTVRDARGRPAANALVLVGGRWRARTDKTGRYSLEFQAEDADRVPARAGGGDFGLASAPIEIRAGELTWDPQLDRGTELSGQLVTPDGKPLANWLVEIEPAGEATWIDGTTTDATGRFSIPNVEDRIYELRAFAPKCALASLHASGLRPGGRHVLPVTRPLGTGTLQAQPRDLAGKPIAGVEVRLWDDATGEGRRLRQPERKQAVADGLYRVVFGAASCGFATHSEVRVASGQAAELGTVLLGAPATVVLPGAADGLRLFHLHAAVPSWIDAEKKRRVRVAPGEYRAFRGDAAFEFTVAAGEELAPDALRER